MLSSVLPSPQAIRVNLENMRAFVRMRRLLATPGELVQQLTQLAETVQLHDEQIKTTAENLQQMVEKAPAAKRTDRISCVTELAFVNLASTKVHRRHRINSDWNLDPFVQWTTPP